MIILLLDTYLFLILIVIITSRAFHFSASVNWNLGDKRGSARCERWCPPPGKGRRLPNFSCLGLCQASPRSDVEGDARCDVPPPIKQCPTQPRWEGLPAAIVVEMNWIQYSTYCRQITKWLIRHRIWSFVCCQVSPWTLNQASRSKAVSREYYTFENICHTLC